MASEQMSSRDNTISEREVHIEKNRVPKMTTHFEHLAEQAKESDVTGGKDTPQGSIQELQGGENRKEHGGRPIGDVGGPGKARETHELGARFESIADKVKGEKEKEKESYADKARTSASNVGKFEMRAPGMDSAGEARGRDRDRSQLLQSRTGEVSGRSMESGADRERRENRGQVEAEKGTSRGVGFATQGPTAVITCRFEGEGEKEERGRDRRELESESDREKARVEENRRRQEAQSQSTLEEISKYRGQVQENTMEAIRGAQEQYERAKQAASQRLGATTQAAQERTAQAKDTAVEKAAQARDTAMEKAGQAKDVTLEKAQEGYVAAKDTLSSATKTASDYTTPVTEKAKDYTLQAAEMAKSAGGTTAHYVGEKAVQAKDVTVETGKTAAEYAGKVAADLKDKAKATGWSAAHYSTEKTVEGTKAAANVVQGTAGYAANKATEIAAKSLGAAKDLAAAAGETAKDYTARKKEEAERELEAKRASQQQGTERRPSSKASEESFQEGKGAFQTITETFQREGKDAKEGGGIGETIGQYAQSMKPTGETLQKMKQPLDSVTQGGSEVLGAVRETVGEIGKTMVKPAERASDTQNQGSGVLDAIGETIAEIAQTTKVIVVGDDETESESKHSISECDRGNQGGFNHKEGFKRETFEARKI